MQLKTIGESLELINSINSVLNNSTLTQADALTQLKLSTKGYSTEALKMAISQSTLNANQIKTILLENGLQGEILETTTAELAQITSTNALATSQTTTAGSTIGLSNAFKGLAASLGITTTALGIIVGALAALGVGAVVYNQWAEKQEELRKAAAESAGALSEQTTALADYSNRYKELREQLISAGNREEEVYNIKQQMLDLQKELNNTFGKEYGQLNLVTDAYKDQTEAIDAYNKKISQNYLNENAAAIATASTKMTSIRHYNLSNPGENANTERGKALKEIAKSYKDEGITLLDELGDGSYSQFSIDLNASAENAYETITRFMNDIREKASELGDEDLFSDILKISSDSLNESKSIINDYGEIYKNSLLSEIAVDDNLSKEYNKAIAAVEKYNNAVLKSENPYKDNNVKEAWDELQTIKKELASDNVWSKYQSVSTETFEQANDNSYSFYQLLKTDKSVSKNATDLNGLTTADLKSMIDDGNNGDAFDKLKLKAKEYGVEVQQLIDLLTQLGYIQGDIQTLTPFKKNTSFTTAWESMGQNIKNKLLDLAASGELTADTLESTDEYKTLLDETGLSAETVVNRINTLVDATDKITAFSDNMKSFSTAYADFEDNGFVSIDNINSMKNVFGDLESFKAFTNIAGNAESESEQIQQAFNDLSTEYLNTSKILDILNEDNKGLIETMLTNADIANTNEIVNKRLAQSVNVLSVNEEVLQHQNEALSAAEKDLESDSWEASSALFNQTTMSALAKIELVNLIAQERIFNSSTLDTSQKITELNKLLLAYDSTGAAAASFNRNIGDIGETDINNIDSQYGTDPRYHVDEQTALNNALNGQKEISNVGSNAGSPSTSKSSGSASTKSGNSGSAGSSNSGTPETFDWIEKRLDRLSMKTEKLKEKFEDAFTLANINTAFRNVNTAIENEITANENAAKRYKSKANAVGLDKKWIKKIQGGTFDIDTISNNKLKEKIQEYQKWNDKVKTCKETITALKETEHDLMLQTGEKIVTYYDSNQNLYSARGDNAQSKLDLMDANGADITSDSYKIYQDSIIKNADSEVKNRKSALKSYKKWYKNNLKDMTREDKLAAKNHLAELRMQIKEAKLARKEAKNAKSETGLTVLQWANDKIKNTQNTLADKISLKNTTGIATSKTDYEEQISLSEQEITNLAAQKAVLEAKKEKLAENSEAYQENQQKINDIDSAVRAAELSQKEWNESIKDIPVEKVEKLLTLLGKAKTAIAGLHRLVEAQGGTLSNSQILESLELTMTEIELAERKIPEIVNKIKQSLAGTTVDGIEYDWGLNFSQEEIDEVMDYINNGQIDKLEAFFSARSLDLNDYTGLTEEIGKLTTAESERWNYLVEAEELYDSFADSYIKGLQKEKEALEDINDAQNRALEFEKLKQKLQTTKDNKTNLIYREGVGFVREADQDTIRDAQNELDDYYYEEMIRKFDEGIEKLEELKDVFNLFTINDDDSITLDKDFETFAKEFTSVLSGIVHNISGNNVNSDIPDKSTIPTPFRINDTILFFKPLTESEITNSIMQYSQPIIPQIPSVTIPDIITNNSEIHHGNIYNTTVHMHGVNDPQEFARQLDKAFESLHSEAIQRCKQR